VVQNSNAIFGFKWPNRPDLVLIWEPIVRLFTRADFDGLVCAAILEELDIVDEITYIHPQDLQNNQIRVTENDIIANAPFVAGMWSLI